MIERRGNKPGQIGFVRLHLRAVPISRADTTDIIGPLRLLLGELGVAAEELRGGFANGVRERHAHG